MTAAILLTGCTAQNSNIRPVEPAVMAEIQADTAAVSYLGPEGTYTKIF